MAKSIEEFSAELNKMNDEVLNFQTYIDNGKKDMRTVAASLRRYGNNMQRGNFQGKVQKNARQAVMGLAGMISKGGGKYDG
jgi:hypothetical protein